MLILVVREDFSAYAQEVVDALAKADIRAEADTRSETLNKRIRQAEVNKVPYILVVGERELTTKQVSVRKRRDGDRGSMALDAFIAQVSREIMDRTQ